MENPHLVWYHRTPNIQGSLLQLKEDITNPANLQMETNIRGNKGNNFHLQIMFINYKRIDA